MHGLKNFDRVYLPCMPLHGEFWRKLPGCPWLLPRQCRPGAGDGCQCLAVVRQLMSAWLVLRHLIKAAFLRDLQILKISLHLLHCTL